MYGLPSNFPYHKLAGAMLIQVCIGEHQLQLHFDSGLSISVGSTLRLNGVSDEFSDFPEVASSICKFLSDTISLAEAPSGKVLRLIFSRGSIEILDDSERYESFQVSIPGETLYVI
jgi:hypothetical protein